MSDMRLHVTEADGSTQNGELEALPGIKVRKRGSSPNYLGERVQGVQDSRIQVFVIQGLDSRF